LADFNVQLAAPQGAGAREIQPYQERVTEYQPNQLIHGLVNIFAKGLEADRKQTAEARKNAVIQEYVRNEQVYSDALTTGSWNASQTATASRANFAKFLGAYPELQDELGKARNLVYTGTEIGQAQQQVDTSIKMRNDQIAAARSAGFVIPDFASTETQDYMIDAHQTRIVMERDLSDQMKRNQEARAAAGEIRAQQSHQIQLSDYATKQQAGNGIITLFSKNIDATNSLAKDVFSNPNIPFEQKQNILDTQIRTLKSGLASISVFNPELATPFNRILDDISQTTAKLADPKNQSATQLQLLKDEYETQMTKAKLLVISDPTSRNAVAVSSLFGNNLQISLSLAGNGVLTGTLAKLGLGPDSGATPKVVGTSDEKQVLSGLKGALNLLQKGGAKGDKEQNTKEAVNAVNEVLRQNSTMDKSIPPQALKELSSFYSSTEFGKISPTLDTESQQNVANVMAVSYVPSVVQAVENRLNSTISTTQPVGFAAAKGGMSAPASATPHKVLDDVNIIFNARGVDFVAKPNATDTYWANSTRQSLKEAADGLNTLIRMGAHLEGTTNYAKYWEDNKHKLLPSVYPDPNKLKPGQVVNGYKYIGGAYGDRNNWEPVSTGQ